MAKPLPTVEEIRVLLHVGEPIPIVVTDEDHKWLHAQRVSWDGDEREESVSN